jgi:hypothetical protein
MKYTRADLDAYAEILHNIQSPRHTRRMDADMALRRMQKRLGPQTLLDMENQLMGFNPRETK